MTEKNRLPKRTNAQKIGASVEDIFSSTFTEFCNVISIPDSRDLGIDFKCEVMEGEYPKGLDFNAQVKGKTEIGNIDSSLSIQIQVTTINYWLSQRSPTFLFVYDYQSENFFWCFPAAYVLSLSKSWRSQQSVSIPLSISSNFSRSITEIPSALLEVIETEDSYRKISDLREEIEEIREQHKAELEYEISGKYEEYWTDIMLEELRTERHR